MKKYILILVLFTFSIFALMAEDTGIVNANVFQWTRSSEDIDVITFNIPDLTMSTMNQQGQDYLKISHPNAGSLLEEGKPELPVFSTLLSLPDYGDPEIELNILSSEIIEDVVIYPQQALISESTKTPVEFIIDEDFYNSNKSYPNKAVTISDPAVMRDYRVANVAVCPFVYNPHSRELTLIKSIEISVSYNTNSSTNPKKKHNLRSRAFDKIYESSILNYQAVSMRDEYQNPNYLFIYPNDTTIENYLEYLVDWKHEKGFEVTAVSTAVTGTSTSSIKNYIQNAYNNWETPPEYICLVGDAGGSYNIPTWTESWSGYGGEGDHPYTLLDGDDILADAFIGRISFNTTTEFQTIISKILNYEKTPYTTNSNWFNHTLLIGDPTHSGQSCISTSLYIKEMMEPVLPMMTFTEEYSSSFTSVMSTAMNQGCAYFNYRGWLGMSGWSNSNTSSLNNGFMLPFVVIITCGTGSFEGTSDARSEYFLKAGTPTTPKGAIACVGTATSGTHTTFNNCVSSGIFYGLFNDDLTSPGAALVRGKLNLYQQFPDNPENKVNIFSYWNNLMGDPGLDLWCETPQELNLSYDSVSQGMNYLEVNVTDEDGYPVRDAWVTFLLGDDDSFATGWTNYQGDVTLNINADVLDTATLTASKPNYIPIQESVPVTQAASLVNISDYQINDDNLGSSSGNGNGQINPGETIELRVKMTNYGSSAAGSVTGNLDNGHNYSVIDSYENYGTIPSGTAVYSIDDFDFSVPVNILGGTSLNLNFTIDSNSGGPWSDHLSFIIEGANIEYDSYTVDDGNDAILAPGETADIQMSYHNLGSVGIENVSVTISSSDSRITFNDALMNIDSIDAGQQVIVTSDFFNVTADVQIIPGSQIPCTLNLSSDTGYLGRQNFMLEVGEVHSYDPLGPDSFGYYIYDDTDTQYSLVPLYNWIEIDPSYGGNGTSLNLYDSGDNGDSADLTLPFNFKFYGINYSTITVSSNGWIALGGSDQISYMNWHVPGPMGASPMIAAFWDDLRIGGGDVLYYYDQTNHQYIVEWSNIQNDYDGSGESFQVIFYDESYYPTESNNGEIKIQYEDVNNVDQGIYSGSVRHGQFATVGIEDHFSERGLEYTYDNDYPSASKVLTDQTALFISTEPVDEFAQADFSTDQFEIQVLPGSSESELLQIGNTGEADLNFVIHKNYNVSRNEDNMRDAGGPDNYGYMWIDSNELGGPSFEWIDISGYGTAVNFTHNDNSPGTYPLGFSVDFYGTQYSNFRINPNGWIGFGSDDNDWDNNEIPETDSPRPAIFPFWDDLHPAADDGGSGSVYYYTNGERLIVMFDNVQHWGSSYPGTYTFEMILNNDGSIKFQYLDMNQTLNSATIGMQNAAGTDALQIAYNQNYVEDNLAVSIRKTIDWLSCTPVSGSVELGQTVNVNITVDSEELELGDYVCNMTITTNDPINSSVVVPVNLSVTEMILEAPQDVHISVVDSSNQVRITWSDVTGATHYNIYISDDPHKPFTEWQLLTFGVTSNLWQGEVNENYRFFRITAEN